MRPFGNRLRPTRSSTVQPQPMKATPGRPTSPSPGLKPSLRTQREHPPCLPLLLLAQALPSASSGVDWLYQFTNNLTNLTTQNGGALTQLGMTELACISFFMLVSMVVNWQTSTMTFRLHHHPIRAGDLTKFLLQLIICCLLETYWVNPFPGASFGINHFFSYIAQAMVAAFDQSSLDSLLKPVEDCRRHRRQMPSVHRTSSDSLLLPCADSSWDWLLRSCSS